LARFPAGPYRQRILAEDWEEYQDWFLRGYVPGPPKRRYLHGSTGIVLALIAAVLLWANVWPKSHSEINAAYGGHHIWEHLRLAFRVRNRRQVYLRTDHPPAVIVDASWRRALVIYNLLIGVAILLPVYFVLEWRIWRRERETIVDHEGNVIGKRAD